MEMLTRLQPGTVVAVDLAFGLVRHFGVVTGFSIAGTPLVTSNSVRRGMVAEEPIDVFAQGCPVIDLGFRGCLMPYEVVMRARASVGTRWSLFRNCEHFVSYTCGEEPASNQLRFWGGMTLLATAIFAASRR